MQFRIFILIAFFCSLNPILNSAETTFYIVRHGQTDWNKEGKKQGQADIPLNAEGKREAEALSVKLKNVHFDLAYSSDLKRAYETATILMADHHLSVLTNKKLRERNYGSWEGRYGEEYDRAPNEEKVDVESHDAVRNRSMELLSKLAHHNPDKTILIVTHAGVIRNIIVAIDTDLSPSDISIKNTAVLKLKFANNRWSIEQLDGILLPVKAAI